MPILTNTKIHEEPILANTNLRNVPVGDTIERSQPIIVTLSGTATSSSNALTISSTGAMPLKYYGRQRVRGLRRHLLAVGEAPRAALWTVQVQTVHLVQRSCKQAEAAPVARATAVDTTQPVACCCFRCLCCHAIYGPIHARPSVRSAVVQWNCRPQACRWLRDGRSACLHCAADRPPLPEAALHWALPRGVHGAAGRWR